MINAIRAHLAEFGIVAPVGRNGVEQLLGVVGDASDRRLPEIARACVAALGSQLQTLKAQILQFDRMIMTWHRSNETSKRLDEIPGVGPALATALVASVVDPKAFRSGPDLGLDRACAEKQHSSGGKERLGNISKRGDRYLRSLFVAGALAVIRYAKIHGTRHRPWLAACCARATHQGCGHSACQQDRTHGLGDRWPKVNATRNLPRSRHKRDRAGHPARCEGWEGEQHVMQSRSIRRSGQPTWATALSNARF